MPERKNLFPVTLKVLEALGEEPGVKDYRADIVADDVDQVIITRGSKDAETVNIFDEGPFGPKTSQG